MKKITAFILVIITLATLFCFSSCEWEEVGELSEVNGKPADEVYNSAIESIRNADNYTLVGTKKITIISDDGKEERIINSEDIMKIVGDDSYVSSKGNDSSFSTVEYWIIDGSYYMLMGDHVSVIPKEYIDQFSPSGIETNNILAQFPKSWFNEESSFCKKDEETGGYILQLVISGEKYTEYMSNMMNDIMPGMELGFKISDYVYLIYFDSDERITKIIIENSLLEEETGNESINYYSVYEVIDVGSTSFEIPDIVKEKL